MELCRLRLVPESAWRTPWQSDTFSGLLCGAIARLEGGEVLRRDVIGPALAGRPPFVVSDAFPGDRLPLPAFVRLLPDWPPEQRKDVKRAKWLSFDAFKRVQGGAPVTAEDLISHSGFHDSAQSHNTISRASSTATGEGGLYSREETLLAAGEDRLTIYVRLSASFRERFWQAVRELATDGFGADRSTGKGQFRVEGEVEPVDSLDHVGGSNGVVVLSTFQPNAGDPTVGAWDAFTKYGKLGPEFGLENVFKRPLVVFKPGACFQLPEVRPWLGRAVPMNELVSSETAAALLGRGADVIHYAFGLAVPVAWPTHALGAGES
jgi:CRISPR-associated protein Csm4